MRCRSLNYLTSVNVDALIFNADLHVYLCAPHGFACPVCHVLTAAGQPGSSLAEASVSLPTLVLLDHVGLSADVSVRDQVDIPHAGLEQWSEQPRGTLC